MFFSREMWESEQFSQNFGSCSQGSQNSSTDLFSQSKMSQHKGFSSIDVWSQPTNSQKMPEVRLSGDRKTWIEKLIIKCTISAIKMWLVSLTLASLDKRLNVHLFTISVFLSLFLVFVLSSFTVLSTWFLSSSYFIPFHILSIIISSNLSSHCSFETQFLINVLSWVRFFTFDNYSPYYW